MGRRRPPCRLALPWPWSTPPPLTGRSSRSSSTSGPDGGSGFACRASPCAPAPAPARPPPSAALTYQPAVDGLRGLAVAGVLLFHGGFSWAKGGYLGVSTFFTLSGYLITTLLLAEFGRTRRVSLPGFWSRRFRRLMPASLLTLAGIVVLFGPFVATADQLAELPGDVIAALAYVANWRFILADQSYADLFTAPSPVQHFWSLAIEEQYYLFFPLLMAGLLAFGRGSRRLVFMVLGALTLGSTLLMMSLYTPGTDPARVYYGTDTRAAELLIGALLAVLLAARPHLLARIPRRALTAAGIAVLVVTAYWWMTVEQISPWLYQGGFTFYALTTAVLLAVLLVPGPVQRALATEPLRQLGRISYGVYLLHWPIFLWLTPELTGLAIVPLFGLRLAVTIPAAVLSFRFVEQPVRTRQILVGPRYRLVAPAAVLVIVFGVVALDTTTDEQQDDSLGAILDASPPAQDPEELLAATPDAARHQHRAHRRPGPARRRLGHGPGLRGVPGRLRRPGDRHRATPVGRAPGRSSRRATGPARSTTG